MTTSEVCAVSFRRIFFVSLDKSVFLHPRCLMSKFAKILILVCRKISSAFYLTLHETFPNSNGYPLMQEFNPFYPQLLLHDGKHFCSILTDLSNLSFLFLQRFLLLSYENKTVSKNAEAAICKCFSKYLIL